MMMFQLWVRFGNHSYSVADGGWRMVEFFDTASDAEQHFHEFKNHNWSEMKVVQVLQASGDDRGIRFITPSAHKTHSPASAVPASSSAAASAPPAPQ